MFVPLSTKVTYVTFIHYISIKLLLKINNAESLSSPAKKEKLPFSEKRLTKALKVSIFIYSNIWRS